MTAGKIPHLTHKEEIVMYTITILEEIHERNEIPKWITKPHVSQRTTRTPTLKNVYFLIIRILSLLSFGNRFKIPQAHILRIASHLFHERPTNDQNDAIREILLKMKRPATMVQTKLCLSGEKRKRL